MTGPKHYVEPKHVETSYRLLALLRVCEDAARNIENVGTQELNAASAALASCMEIAADLAGIVHDALDPGRASSPLSAMAKAYRDAHDAFNAARAPDGSAEAKRLEAEFDASRDSIFLYRPVNMREVSEKATILLEIWDQGEGLNADRVKHLFEAFGGKAVRS